MRRVRRTAGITVTESGLLSVRTGKPAEEVVERAVLHHHDYDVLESGGVRRRQRLAESDFRYRPEPRCNERR